MFNDSVVSVDPLTNEYNYHVTLDDGYKSLGFILATKEVLNPDAFTGASIDRTAIRTATGGTSPWWDFIRPWVPYAQDDFSGGLGNLNVEEAGTAYRSGTINSSHGKLILTGLRMFGTGIRGQHVDMPGDVTWHKMNTSTYAYFAKRIPYLSAFTGASIDVILRRVGSPSSLTIKYRQDSSGPSSTIASTVVTTETCPDYISYHYRLSISDSITVGLVRWLSFEAEVDPDNYWMIACSTTVVDSKISSDGSTWYPAPLEPYCIVRDAEIDYIPKFFDYKYAKYIVLSKEGSNPRLFMQGWRGIATANADVDGLTDSTQTWPVNGLIGMTITVFEGKGSTQVRNTFTITSNSATKVYFDRASASSFDTTTAYVIQGGLVWNEITGHGLTGICSDVMTHLGIVYFCLGKTANIRKMQWKVSTLYQYDDDGTNKASYITLVHAPAATRVWIANNDLPSVAKASVTAWGTPMTFGSALEFKDYAHGRITNIGEYGENQKVLWVMREGFIYEIDDDNVVTQFPIAEIALMTKSTNGVGFLPTNIHLWFNWGSSVFKWYNNELKEVGPIGNEGLPNETIGYCTYLISSAGFVYAVYQPYDTVNGFSAIYQYNDTGWCEYYRASRPGVMIKDVSFQTVDNGPSKMWIFEGSDIIAIPFPARFPMPYRDPNYLYNFEGTFVSSYYAANMYNISKLYNSIWFFASNLSSHAWIEVDYRLDEDVDWIPLKNFATQGPAYEINLKSADTRLSDAYRGVTGRQFQYRARIYTSVCSTTPIIRSIVIEAISRIPVKYAFTASVKIEDNMADLNQHDSFIKTKEVIDQLKEWATNLTPLRMRSVYPELDDYVVFIEPPPIYPGSIEGSLRSLTIVMTEL